MSTRILRLYPNLLLGIWGLLVASIFIFNTLHYRLYFQSWSSATERFLVPVVVEGLIFLAFRLSVPTKLVIANMLVGMMAALYAGEFYLAWRLDHRQQQAAKASGGVFDGRDKLRRAGVDAYPIIRGENLLVPDVQGQLHPVLTAHGRPLLPMASIPFTTVVVCNETGAWQIYKTDRHGFNNPDEEWDVTKPAIGIVGDSFAHGSCVPPEQNMAAVLRKRFGSAVNTGVGGFGPLFELAALREYLQPLRPRIVLWAFFVGNDLNENLPVEVLSPLLNRYLSDDNFSQDLIHRSPEIAVLLRRYLDENLTAAMNRVDNPYENLLRYVSLDRVREFVGLGPIQIGYNLSSTQEELDLFAKILQKARDRVEGWGGKFYLVYLPESDRYLSKFGNSSVRQAIYRGVKEIAEREHIPMIDVAAALAEDPSPGTFYAYPGSHFNAKGYKAAGEAIAAALERDSK